jgi:hypothetical protein
MVWLTWSARSYGAVSFTWSGGLFLDLALDPGQHGRHAAQAQRADQVL